MQRPTIPDKDIPDADPTAVIEQYKRLVFKLANRYIPVLQRSGVYDLDDLYQAGYMAILDSQKRYDPEKCTFRSLLFYNIRRYMRGTVEINPVTGLAPARLVYLDEPISEDGELSLIDMIEDPDQAPMDEPIVEEENRRETSERVRSAIDRMKSDKQRQAVSMVWLDGKTREDAADEMGMKKGAFYALEKYGRNTLRRDWELRKYAQSLLSLHVGVNRFNTTWTSATEQAALWRVENLPEYMSLKEAEEETNPGKEWTPAQHLAHMKRR